MAVDTERFTRNPSSHQPGLSVAVQEALADAFDRCGYPEIWGKRRFPQATGDGYLLGVLPEEVPFLVYPFLDSLHDVLVEKDESLRAIDRNLRLRLRVSINMGPVPDLSDDERRNRIGDPTNATCRLLDSTALRKVLTQSNPNITLLAAIFSKRVFEDVIRGEYSPEVHSDRLAQVTAEVPGKDFAEPAWIYVPRPSRGIETEGAEEPPGTPIRLPEGRQAQKLYHNAAGQQINADHIHGDISYGGRSS